MDHEIAIGDAAATSVLAPPVSSDASAGHFGDARTLGIVVTARDDDIEGRCACRGQPRTDEARAPSEAASKGAFCGSVPLRIASVLDFAVQALRPAKQKSIRPATARRHTCGSRP
jgi:hypothetical protein